MRIVVVSNTTMRLAARLPEHDVVVSGVGDLPRWLLEPNSPADDPAVDVVVVHADGASLLPRSAILISERSSSTRSSDSPRGT